jgi:hypothetical protein
VQRLIWQRWRRWDGLSSSITGTAGKQVAAAVAVPAGSLRDLLASRAGGGGAGGETTAKLATSNTGGGGGGGRIGASVDLHGGNGGSGVVILRYPDTYTATFSAGVTADHEQRWRLQGQHHNRHEHYIRNRIIRLGGTMAHFAKLDENNIVIFVTVGRQEDDGRGAGTVRRAQATCIARPATTPAAACITTQRLVS